MAYGQSHRDGNGDDRNDDRDHTHASVSNLVFFGDSLTDNGNLFALTGIPPAPFWHGRFSNGPTYAEQLPSLLGVPGGKVQNYAYGGATSQTTHAAPIDLGAQVQAYLTSLAGKHAPKGTEAVLYIGNNDYLNYDPATGNPPPVQQVIAHIQSAITTLTSASVGVDKVVLFTLPDFSITPAAQALDPALVAGANAIIDASNAALKALVAQDNAAGLHITIVDANVLGNAVAADGHAFGLADLSIPIIDQNNQFTGVTDVYAPNEIAFFNPIHPTFATAGIQAAFAAATLDSDHVQLFTTGGANYNAPDGSAFVFAVQGGNTFHAGNGTDIIYAGNGNNTVYGGIGSDLIFAGGGGNHLYGGNGTSLLATNSGDNTEVGGRGEDILVANRSGNNTLTANGEDNFIILKENAGAAVGHETISGHGETTLRFIINDQNPAAEQALITEFNTVVAAYKASLHTNHYGTFTVDGITATGITGIQLQVDSVDAHVPYQIDHTIVQSVGETPELHSAGQQLLHQASLWGLLTV